MLVVSGPEAKPIVERTGVRFALAGLSQAEVIARLASRTRGTPGDGIAPERIVHYFLPRAFGEIGVEPEELKRLARGGYWARQLAVCHPACPPGTLARLLCDDDPKFREWAAAHPCVPTDVISDIYRAGGAHDFQGVAEGDPDMPVEDLRRVASLGPWGAWIVAWHPNAPDDLAARRDQEPVL